MKAKIGLGAFKFSFGPGYILGGYSARAKPSEGVHDDIYSRALVIDNEQGKACLISIDFVGLEKIRVEKVKSRIHEQFGIPTDHIMISAIHTHSAPLNIELFTHPYEGFEEVYDGIFESVSLADNSMFIGSLEIGKVDIHKAVFNRRDWDEHSDYLDEQATALIIKDSEGIIKGIMYNYSNHPVVMDDKNLLISADWPHFTGQKLREQFSSDLFVMFINGTPGNTNPINSPMSGGKTRTFDDCKDIGVMTAEGLIKLIETAEPLSGEKIAGKTKDVKIIADDEEKEEIFTFANGKIENGEYIVTTVVQVLRIGDFVIVSAPGEYFPQIAKTIKEKSPFKYTMVAGYTNDYIGYVGKREHYLAGGYEMFMMSLSEDEGEILETASLELLTRIS